MKNFSSSDLANLSVFEGVPARSLDWFWSHSSLRELQKNEVVFSKGNPITHTLVIFEGNLRIYFTKGHELNESVLIEAGSVTGFLPFSRARESTGEGVVSEDGVVLFFPKEDAGEMIKDHYELTEALVHQMSTRIRTFTNMQQLSEKMIALGKLSAGLAHELNNPAAAIARSSALLTERIAALPATFSKVLSFCLPAATAEKLAVILERKAGSLSPDERPKLSIMQRSQREDELYSRLKDCSVENFEEVSDNLFDFGFTDSELDHIEGLVEPPAYSAVYNWISDLLAAERVSREINDAGQRISDLVRSVKVFTHMDRSPDKQDSNIHEGIRNTLAMLNYRVRKGNIELVTKFDETIPRIPVFVGELNQVWTNLIDNALDAMEEAGSGELTILTEANSDYIKITIGDTGPGIPDEIKTKIFNPFFTTKDIGKGTGLGLESAFTITAHHNGTLKFESVPGNTNFIVCLPIKPH